MKKKSKKVKIREGSLVVSQNPNRTCVLDDEQKKTIGFTSTVLIVSPRDVRIIARDKEGNRIAACWYPREFLKVKKY